jgi:hypothetical protein
MTWNHRVVKRTFDSRETSYGIEEVYYDADGNIEGWTDTLCIGVIGDTKQDLVESLNRMIAACYCKPVLELIDGKLIEIDE